MERIRISHYAAEAIPDVPNHSFLLPMNTHHLLN